jgi:hypothetical protein
VDDQAKDLFRSWLDVLRLPAGGGHEVVYAPLSGEARLLTQRRAARLFGCARFATIDEHAARLSARGFGDASEIRADLRELSRSGHLVSASGLVRRARDLAPRDEASPPPIAAIGIPTRNRVEDVRGCLASFIDNGLRHGRAIEYLVAEGEVTDETREATRASLVDLTKRFGVTIAHAGVPEKRAYAARLAERSGVPRELCEIALLRSDRSPNDNGSSRNAILLHFAGDMHIQIDDDTRARFAPAPGREEGLALTSTNDPSESWFPGKDAEALPERVVADRCFVALHEELLGRGVCGLVEAHRQEGLDLDHAGAAFFRRLVPTGGRVLYTQIGAAGDTGTGSMWHYLLFRGPTRDRLHRSEEGYRRAFVERRSVRVTRRTSISDAAFCLGMALGIDARGVVPPFLPIQRNSDGLFGIVARVCFHDTFSGFVPWAMEHTPPGRRTSTFEAFFESLGHSWGEDMLCALVAGSHVIPEHDDPARSLRALGAWLQHLGALPTDELEEVLRVHVLRARTLDLVLLDDALHAYGGSPAYWAKDVERAIALLRKAVERPSLAMASDIAEVHGPEGARLSMQRLVRRYGELCSAWPDMLAAAAELRREGVRIGVRVA